MMGSHGRRAAGTGWYMVVALLVVVPLVSACQPRRLTPDEVQALRKAVEAHQAYARSDCDFVLEQTRSNQLEEWPNVEIRHSMRLLRGFCREREGDTTKALRIYRDLIREAPDSFAADDARERRRLLKLDPDAAPPPEIPSDLGVSAAGPAPIERVPAPYPPVPRTGGIEGYAVIAFGISPEGETVDPVILDSQPPLLFDGTSLRTVRRWTFEPDPSTDPSERRLIRIVFKRREGAPGEFETQGELEDLAR